jgi:GTP cyclohydrolase I
MMSSESNLEYLRKITEDKYDPILGERVRQHLVAQGYENPVKLGIYDPRVAAEWIMGGLENGLRHLGIDMLDPSMADTPRRYAHMLVGELTRGLNYGFFPKCTYTPNGQIKKTSKGQDYGLGSYDQMVLVDSIRVLSLCEHHLQTIDGFAHIAYVPGPRLLGLSKLARVTEFFSRRPQVQERLTNQIYEALRFILDTDDIAVVIKATHYCMKARGSLQHSSLTTTDKMGGKFMTVAALREEFFHAIHARA